MGRAGSHSPDGDGAAAVSAFFAAEYPVLPALSFGAVEDDQVAGLRCAAVHVAGRLLQSLADRLFQALAQHPALDHEPAGGVRILAAWRAAR